MKRINGQLQYLVVNRRTTIKPNKAKVRIVVIKTEKSELIYVRNVKMDRIEKIILRIRFSFWPFNIVSGNSIILIINGEMAHIEKVILSIRFSFSLFIIEYGNIKIRDNAESDNFIPSLI
jgi:regulator of extracellular matrix RemA (YlzA/DUF370 family)